jgi:MFS family permease
MASLGQMLQRWQEAGLLDFEAVSRILAFEKSREPERREGPGVVEALVYLGLAVVGVGVFVLAAVNWGDLPSWARVAVAGAPGVLSLPLGQALRTMAEPGLRRGGAMSWLVGGALITAAAIVAAHESDWRAENAVLAGGVVAGALGVLLWSFSKTIPQVVGLAAAAGLLSAGFGARFDDDNIPLAIGFSLLLLNGAGVVLVVTKLLVPRLPAHTLATIGLAVGVMFVCGGAGNHAGDDNGAFAFGSTLVLFAAAAVFLTEFEWLAPRELGRVWAGLGLALGSLMSGVEPGPPAAELIAFIAGAFLVAASLQRGSFVYMGFGIAAIFIGLVVPIVRHVDDPTVAAIALIVLGLLLLGGVGLLARYRPWARRGPGASNPPAPPLQASL